MRPELPYLAAGSITIAGGIARDKGWPSEGTSALVATLVLVIVASATANTKAAPVVHAVGLLLLLTAVMAATPVLKANQVRKGK
jgi:hypothetical protein